MLSREILDQIERARVIPELLPTCRVHSGARIGLLVPGYRWREFDFNEAQLLARDFRCLVTRWGDDVAALLESAAREARSKLGRRDG